MSTRLPESQIHGDAESNETAYITETKYSDKVVDDEFIKDHVSCLFDPIRKITYEDKARFGDLMQVAGARMTFAKFIDAQRSEQKCVSETTFYKLLHSFALVLFECEKADDYRPGKTLMNMAFTYYCAPNSKQITPQDLRNFKTPRRRLEHQTYVEKEDNSAITHSGKKAHKKSALSKKFRKIFDAKKVKHGLDPHIDVGCLSFPPHDHAVDGIGNKPIFQLQEKQYLYEHLKSQEIWQSLRFWNECFLIAVNDERSRCCTHDDWSALSTTEKESNNLATVNVTFSQLLTFINNMKSIGLSKQTCLEFLEKHSVIGGIPIGGQYHGEIMKKINA